MVMYLCISVLVLPLSTIFVSDFETVPTVWYLCLPFYSRKGTAQNVYIFCSAVQDNLLNLEHFLFLLLDIPNA